VGELQRRAEELPYHLEKVHAFAPPPEALASAQSASAQPASAQSSGLAQEQAEKALANQPPASH
jgi:hypothetical protein